MCVCFGVFSTEKNNNPEENALWIRVIWIRVKANLKWHLPMLYNCLRTKKKTNTHPTHQNKCVEKTWYLTHITVSINQIDREGRLCNL